MCFVYVGSNSPIIQKSNRSDNVLPNSNKKEGRIITGVRRQYKNGRKEKHNKKVIIKGTEEMIKEYKNPRHHIKGAIIGIGFGGLVGLVLVD